jgi:hypothetical protein
MLRGAVSKALWVGRATSAVVGLAIVLALVVGLASAAFGANGQAWILGQANVATAITSLGGAAGVDGPMVRITNNDAGTDDTALDLRVQSGEAPMRVNSASRVSNLNADELDGKNATGIGVNGLERVSATSDNNSVSPKSVGVSCPAGKVVVGTGADIIGGKSGTFPNEQTDVVIDTIRPTPSSPSTGVGVSAYEETATNANWTVEAYAICATAP